MNKIFKKILIVLSLIVVLFAALQIMSSFKIINKPPLKIIKDLTKKEDERIGMTEEEYIKDLSLETLYIGTLKPSENGLENKGYIKGSTANDTLLVLKTKNGKGIDSYIKKIELTQNKNKVDINYSGYKNNNDELIMFITFKGVHTNIEGYKLKMISKSISKDTDMIIEKDVPKNITKIKDNDIVEASFIGNINRNHILKLTSKAKTNFRKEDDKIYATKNIRFIQFGPDKIDIKKFKLISNNGKRLPARIIAKKKTSTNMVDYYGEKTLSEITLVIELLENGDSNSSNINRVEKTFNNATLNYDNTKFSMEN